MGDTPDSLSAEADTLSEIIRLSVSSYGETQNESNVRKLKLLELGSGHELFGYEVSNMESPSDYLLTCEDVIKTYPSCWGCCSDGTSTLDELSFMLSNKKTGSNLIHIHTAENLQNNKHELAENYRTCIKIVINAETKGVVKLDFPPSATGMHGDYSEEMIPVAVISQDEQLVFIFRPSTLEKNGNVTEIITADGTGFVVAKVGPADSLLNDAVSGTHKKRLSVRSRKMHKDHFCVMFLDRLLGRSWKQLLFSVSTVFFYLWLIHKSYRPYRKRQNSEDTIGKFPNTSECPVI